MLKCATIKILYLQQQQQQIGAAHTFKTMLMGKQHCNYYYMKHYDICGLRQLLQRGSSLVLLLDGILHSLQEWRHQLLVRRDDPCVEIKKSPFGEIQIVSWCICHQTTSFWKQHKQNINLKCFSWVLCFQCSKREPSYQSRRLTQLHDPRSSLCNLCVENASKWHRHLGLGHRILLGYQF